VCVFPAYIKVKASEKQDILAEIINPSLLLYFADQSINTKQVLLLDNGRTRDGNVQKNEPQRKGLGYLFITSCCFFASSDE